MMNIYIWNDIIKYCNLRSKIQLMSTCVFLNNNLLIDVIDISEKSVEIYGKEGQKYPKINNNVLKQKKIPIST